MEQYPGGMIAKLYRRSQSFWEKRLKAYDITTAEYPILILLHEKDGITQEEIAKRLGIDKSAITRSVRSLMDKGRIRREKDTQDLRCNRIYLTEFGQESLVPIQEGMKEWNQVIKEELEADEIDAMANTLSRILKNVDEYLSKDGT